MTEKKDRNQAKGDSELPVIENPTMTSPEDDHVAALLEHSLDVSILASAVEAQEAPDAADTLESLDEGDAAQVLEEMDLDSAAEALSHMLPPLASSVLDDLVEENPQLCARLLESMPADDAADLLQDFDSEICEGLLSKMSAGTRDVLRQLLAYDQESAGGIMTPEVLRVLETMTVNEAVDAIREAEIEDDTQYVFVIDAEDRLSGILGLRRLVLADPTERISEICDREVDAIPPDLDREEVAREFEKYEYLVLPVIDAERHLLGVVTVDDVIDSIRAEGTEDAQKMVGAGREEFVFSPTFEKLKSRAPWLLVNLVTSSVAAIVVLQFENLIAEIAILAVLMPVIANQSGNAGQQSLAVTLRGIVLDQVRPALAGRIIFREGLVGLINGCLAGLLVGLVVSVVQVSTGAGTWRLGAVLAISMACSLTIGTLTGAGLPLLMRRFGVDPATASTIFLTMVTDSMSFFVFLGLASAMSNWLMVVPA
ncbi:MAG: magnesium transporter [Phycisphaerales bacterium]|nr:magnesium transporter [Phycisphaerales bacterium]